MCTRKSKKMRFKKKSTNSDKAVDWHCDFRKTLRLQPNKAPEYNSNLMQNWFSDNTKCSGDACWGCLY